jgi:hypothetical protein
MIRRMVGICKAKDLKTKEGFIKSIKLIEVEV